MVKGKIGSKAAEKKKERIAMQRKMDARLVFVNAANQQVDPLATLPSFKKFTKNGLEVTLSTERVTDINEQEKNLIVDLLVRNMKKLYEESNWGWNEKNKREEMLEDAAWYLMARNAKGELCGFSHFRYDMDFDDEVLYVYEIQLEENVRRKGLGKFMMQVLEMLAFKADMRKIMLTVLKHNPAAKSFFKNQMKFEMDETCPTDDVYEQFDYEILSKFNKRKLARELAAEKQEVACSQKGGCCG